MHQTVNLTAQAYGGSNPSIPRKHAGVAQLARASAFQAEGCEFESHCPLHYKNLQIKVESNILLLSTFILLNGSVAQLVRAHD